MQVKPQPNLAAYVRRADRDYDPDTGLVWSRRARPGYHTSVSADDAVHEIRGSADYALALLQTGEPDRRARACDVLDAIVAHQVTDPTDRHFGIWGYYLEETPAQMTPADWNWADFIGARLAQVLTCHLDQLRPETATAVQDALRRAALAIFRRNVTPHYTNIAVMGAVVTAAAGELLDMPFLVEYGRRRLNTVRTLTDEAGGFEEYNSPTYTRVALEELERAVALVRDADLLATAEALRGRAWETFAERFHPGTGQLAGPQSRAYSDWLSQDMTAWLTRRTGVPITARDVDDTDPSAKVLTADLVPALPCPPELADRFAKLPADPTVVRTRFSLNPGVGETTGTTWLTADACLGSVNIEHAWHQRRTLLGYWRTDDDPAVCLRARMLLNGQDLTAAWVRQSQDGPRVLSAWWLSYDAGFTHPYFDKPPDSLFEVDDLRARVVLRGRGVQARQLDGARLELVAGDWRAVLHQSPAAFQPSGRAPSSARASLRPSPLHATAARWELGSADDAVWVDAVLYRGPRRTVDFHTVRLHLGWGLELLHRSAEPTAEPVVATDVDQFVSWRWRDLGLAVPAMPTPFDAPLRESAHE